MNITEVKKCPWCEKRITTVCPHLGETTGTCPHCGKPITIRNVSATSWSGFVSNRNKVEKG